MCALYSNNAFQNNKSLKLLLVNWESGDFSGNYTHNSNLSDSLKDFTSEGITYVNLQL